MSQYLPRKAGKGLTGRDFIYLTPARLCKQEARRVRCPGGHAPWIHNDYGVDGTYEGR